MAYMNRAEITETLASIGIEVQPEHVYPNGIVVYSPHLLTVPFERGCGHRDSLGITTNYGETETPEQIIATVERCKNGKCVSCWTREYAEMDAKKRSGKSRRTRR